MKIALIGYGKMGKTIEELAIARGHSISFKIDQDNPSQLQEINPDNTDIAIEFSQPDTAFENIKNLISQGVKTIAGTTGWLDRYDEIVLLCKKNQGTFLYASNFSIGVNLFFELNEWLTARMAQLEGFTVAIEEIHHTEKKDAPSGTAISLAEGVINQNRTYQKWVNQKTDDSRSLPIISKREPDVPGTHTIAFQSALETIEITHIAHDRKVFADGVIKVAEWATNQIGVLTIQDFLNQHS